MTRAYTLECRAFHIEVECDDQGIIILGSVRARKFIGQPLETLCTWMRKFGGFSIRPADPALFDAVVTTDPASEKRS
jgi:hypothetical protein